MYNILRRMKQEAMYLHTLQMKVSSRRNHREPRVDFVVYANTLLR